MKTETQTRQEQETAQRKPKNQGSVSQILQAYKLKHSQSTAKVAQCKPFFVPGPGRGFIPFMGAQYDAAYRSPEHHELLTGIPADQCFLKTFHQENDHASQYPMQGSRSIVGDLGIGAHVFYNSLRNWYPTKGRR